MWDSILLTVTACERAYYSLSLHVREHTAHCHCMWESILLTVTACERAHCSLSLHVREHTAHCHCMWESTLLTVIACLPDHLTSKNLFHHLFYSTTQSFCTGQHPPPLTSLVYQITPSPPTHNPVCQIYRKTSEPSYKGTGLPQSCSQEYCDQSCGTQTQEWRLWQGPITIYPTDWTTKHNSPENGKCRIWQNIGKSPAFRTVDSWKLNSHILSITWHIQRADMSPGTLWGAKNCREVNITFPTVTIILHWSESENLWSYRILSVPIKTDYKNVGMKNSIKVNKVKCWFYWHAKK
jgi:hypothetical protein